MVGQQVLCPYCNARLLVPEGGGRAEPVDASPVSAPVAPSHPTSVEPGRAIVIEKPIEPQPGTSKSSTGASSASATEETARKQDHSIFRPAAGDEIVDPELAVKDEGTRLVKVGDQYVEIRRLSPEEKAARRFKRNIIMVVMAAVVLGVVIFFLVER